jgi:tetratricopeptide (TPR) repeat protein
MARTDQRAKPSCADRRGSWFVATLAACAVLPAISAMADDRAVCQDQAQPPAEAIAACGRLIDSGQLKGDELAGVYIWRGWHLTITGQHQRAIADYTEALRLNDRLAGAYRERGASLERVGDLAGAAENFRQALAIDPALQDVAEALRRVEAKLASGRSEPSPAADGGYLGVLLLDVASELLRDPRIPAPPQDSLMANTEDAKNYNMRVPARFVLVVDIDANGPAWAARLEFGTVILKFDGVEVHDKRELVRLVRQTPPGKEVWVDTVRASVRVGDLSLAPQLQQLGYSSGSLLASADELSDFLRRVPADHQLPVDIIRRHVSERSAMVKLGGPVDARRASWGVSNQ